MDSNSANSLDFNTFTLPTWSRHSTQESDGQPPDDHYGVNVTTNPDRWENWIVKLHFKKRGVVKHGSGFYVNVPNANFDVIVTAGHNLTEAANKHCTDIKIITKDVEIPVSLDMVHVCQKYFERPTELNAIYDYGVILLKRGLPARRGFGFNLMLGFSPKLDENENETEKDVLHDRGLNVSGYRPKDEPPEPPRRSDGICFKATQHQLEYESDTEPGMSGGAVWLGFRGVETVVAIHNYGGNGRDEHNRGTRLTLNVWRTIFEWVKIGWNGVSLHYSGFLPNYSAHLHIHLYHNDTSQTTPTGIGRVRIGKPGRVDTLFDILPISAPPDSTEIQACYGFLLNTTSSHNGTVWTALDKPASLAVWLRWDPKTNKVSLTDRFDPRCEVKLRYVISAPGKPFEIHARLSKSTWKLVRMEMALLHDADLECLEDEPLEFEDTTEIAFVPISIGPKLFEFRSSSKIC